MGVENAILFTSNDRKRKMLESLKAWAKLGGDVLEPIP
jgi:hypothetical protein